MEYRVIKRVLDFFFALAGLLILSPLLVVVFAILKVSGEREAFYLQKRIGYKNRPFHIIKFSSMLKNSPNMVGGYATLRNDPRVTPVGKWLRYTKMNELPQLWNVIVGEMSFVGPRPLPEQSFVKYNPEVKSRLYSVRPGITGMGSLIFRDEEKLVTAVRDLGFEPLEYYKKYIYPYKGVLEMWYLENTSFTTDLKILMLTFWLILFPRSEWTIKVLRGLPKRPDELTFQGLKSLPRLNG